MNKHLHFFIIVAIFLFTPRYIQAQNIQNLSFKVEGDKIRVTYDLNGETFERYTITLFSSKDFTTPLKFVSGDVGEDVVPGIGKSILWDARSEFAEYKGPIRLKIKYKISSFQTFTEIAENSKFKRGKTQTIKWLDGPKTLTAELDLYQGTVLMEKVALHKSGIDWTWEVNKKTKSGKGYKFKTLINGKPAFSPEFKISRKAPIAFIIIPLVAAGTVAAILLSDSDKDDEIIELPLEPN